MITFVVSELSEGDICTQVEPGMSMVCEKDGTNCHLTNIQCFSSHGRGNYYNMAKGYCTRATCHKTPLLAYFLWFSYSLYRLAAHRCDSRGLIVNLHNMRVSALSGRGCWLVRDTSSAADRAVARRLAPHVRFTLFPDDLL